MAKNGNGQAERLREMKTGRWAGVGVPRRQMMGLFAGVEKYRQRRWLASYITIGEVLETARVAGLSFSNHYHWLRNDPDYVKAFEVAKEIATDFGEDELHRRGVRGILKPVIFKGKITDSFLEYSDTCLIASLKANRPAKYRDSLIGLTSNAPAGITINLIGGQAEAHASKQTIEGPEDACFHNDTSTDRSTT